MVLDPAANFVRGTTDAQINSTNTTLSVNDASIFPDPSSDGEYNVVVWDADNHPRPDQDSDVEIMRVSARDTNNNDLTVSRGQETTSGAAHPSGAAVQLSPTAKMFGDIETTFGNFWDAGASELTADVNNDSVNTDNLSINDWKQIDVVEQGVDNTGGVDASSDIESLVADERVLVFPAGTYDLSAGVNVDDKSIAFIAKGDVTITGDTSSSTYLDFGATTACQDVLVHGFACASQGTHRAIAVAATGTALVEDVTVTGTYNQGENGAFRVDPAAIDATITFRDCHATDGGNQGGADDPIGLLVASGAPGTTRVEDCHIAGFANNGVYASAANGPTHIDGGRYGNCGNAQVRIGGDGSSVRDCEIYNDSNLDSSFSSPRGLWVRAGTSQMVENVQFTITTDNAGTAMVVANEAGSCTVLQAQFDITADINAISPAAPDGTEAEEELRLIGVDLDHTGVGSSTTWGMRSFRKTSMLYCRWDAATGTSFGSGGLFGLRLDGADSAIIGGDYQGDERAVALDANNIVVAGNPSFTGTDAEGLNIRGGNDIDLRLTNGSTIASGGTRPRWNGVIGGGPLGGVDLSSTTGQFEGDHAIADGTSAANAGDMARWDSGNTRWDVFQPATTV